MGDRAILHVDMNSFYASVEQAERPELRGLPMVVGGDEEARHGIVLAKSVEAKRYGVKTAETLWQARRKCPDLVVAPPHYALYQRYSRLAREIYNSYTPLVEDFGLDECWLDLTGCPCLDRATPYAVAWEIKERVKRELDVTVSVGVSWNRVFVCLVKSCFGKERAFLSGLRTQLFRVSSRAHRQSPDLPSMSDSDLYSFFGHADSRERL